MGEARDVSTHVDVRIDRELARLLIYYGDDDATDIALTYQERDLLDYYRQLSEEQQFQFRYAMQCEATRSVQARIARARSNAQRNGGA